MGNLKNKWKKLILMYNIVDILAVLIFYPLIPKLLNYPPNSIDNAFQVAINGLTYTQQYFSILILCIFIENLILFLTYKNTTKILNTMNKKSNKEKLYLKVVKIIEKAPKTIYLLQVIAPVIAITITFLILNGNFEVILKVVLVFLAMLLTIATISYVFAKRIFKAILIEIFNRTSKNKKAEKEILNKIKRRSIINTVIFMVIPLLIITIVFVTFISYSKSTSKNGNNLYKIYNDELNEKIGEKEYKTLADLKKSLNQLEFVTKEDSYYIIYPDGKVETNSSKQNISEFFIKYSEEISKMQEHKNRTYEFYATDIEGVFKEIYINNQKYMIGIRYSTATEGMINNIVLVSIIIIILSIILLLYTVKYIFEDILSVTKKLNEMSKTKKIDLNDRLPISSNDEISDLIKSFTSIQEKTNKYIEQIEQDQYTMQRQAQFAILGEFAGGLAHDLNSPLSAVKLDISTLKKYMNSDKISADENIKNKLNEMLDNIDSSLNSMGNIIMGVRNQIRSTGDTEREQFLLIDVLEGIKILFRSILMKNNCQLEVDIPSDLAIYGEKNKLDRVIGNVIRNSIDAYVEKSVKGVIKVNAKKANNRTIISISDKAGGIDDSVKEKIFKEIKTTKKERGTGFGLYYSNTLIESSFKGKMYFDTEKDVGTTFYIEIPNNKEEK